MNETERQDLQDTVDRLSRLEERQDEVLTLVLDLVEMSEIDPANKSYLIETVHGLLGGWYYG